MMFPIHNCIFCNVDKNLILQATGDFLVLREPYPLVEGHIMIVSKEHYGCSGELPSDWLGKLAKLKATYTDLIKEAYGFVSTYEHGRAGTCHVTSPTLSGGEACHHFHLHILPIKFSIQDDLKKSFKTLDLQSFEEVNEAFFKFGEYILFENNAGKTFFSIASGITVPPHLMRTLISKHLGRPELANWQNSRPWSRAL